MQLYISTQLNLRGKYPTFYSTTIVWQLYLLITSTAQQKKTCISKSGDLQLDFFKVKFIISSL